MNVFDYVSCEEYYGKYELEEEIRKLEFGEETSGSGNAEKKEGSKSIRRRGRRGTKKILDSVTTKIRSKRKASRRKTKVVR